MAPLAPVFEWLADPELARLFATLNQAGETRFVGGCVRDGLRGVAHGDIDLATTILPEDAMAHVTGAGFRTVPTGLTHGTFTVALPRGPVEVTTLRRDVETDGRHATVAFTDDWQADAARRDFTINALSCDGDGRVFDYFVGLDDLAARRVRFIGAAEDRIAEDYLRTLRFFRFTARFARAPDEAAMAAIRKMAAGASGLSGERIHSELFKLLSGPRAAEMWRAMIAAGVMTVLLPQATDADRLARVIDIEDRNGLNDPLRRLMGALTEMTMTIVERLRLSNEEKQRLLSITDTHRVALLREGKYAQALYKADPQSVIDIAILDSAASGDEMGVPELLAFLSGWSEPKFPLNGGDVRALGLQPGPKFGELLDKVEAWWIARNFRPTREECVAELENVVSQGF